MSKIIDKYLPDKGGRDINAGLNIDTVHIQTRGTILQDPPGAYQADRGRTNGKME